MENIMMYVWLIIAAVSLVIEDFTAALVAIWFIPSALICALIAKLGGGILVQLIVFFVLSALFIIFARRIFAKFITPKFTPTNADALIGGEGIVIETVNDLEARGVVKVKGQVWSAKTKDGNEIEAGKRIEVLAIEGVKLVVKEK